ncbi:MAG: ribosomal protein S18-alanine N-acetyltransferase [Acidobacteriota bacterium]|nr:ribosomal protein S18-alanine N-acetyltransferase [Acidobacteriota bacterium]
MSPVAREARIRPMTAADLDRVIEIAASLSQAPHWPREVYAAALDADAAPRRIALVAEDAASGITAGFAMASLTPPEAELETIAVAAGLQRRGLARQLFQTLARALRQQQVRVTLLEVRASNEQALAFYRALGFEAAGRRRRYYADPIEDAALMRLVLD